MRARFATAQRAHPDEHKIPWRELEEGPVRLDAIFTNHGPVGCRESTDQEQVDAARHRTTVRRTHHIASH